MGKTAILKASPTSISNRPSQKSRLLASEAEAALKALKLVLLDAAKIRAMPKTRKAADRAPITRYFTPASSAGQAPPAEN